MNPPTWLDELGRPRAKRSCPRCGREIPVVTFPAEHIRELEELNGEKCPRCRKMGWRITDSRPDPSCGIVGVARRTYTWSECGVSESKTVH